MSIAPFELYPKIQIPAPWNSIPIYKPNVSVHQICCYNSLHHQRHRKGIQHVLNRMYNTASWLSVKDESLSPWQQRRIGMTMNSRLRISTSSHAELSSCAACSPPAEPNHLINDITALQLLLPHPLNGLFSRTTWVSQYQTNKTSLDLNEARHDGVLGWQWHQLDNNRIISSMK